MQLSESKFHLARLAQNATALSTALEAEHANELVGASTRPATIARLRSVLREDIKALAPVLLEDGQ